MHKSEHSEQCEVIRWSLWQNDERLRLLFAVPNGGWRHIRTAAYLKAEGVKAGVPDLLLPVPSAPYHGLFIEMKRKGGTVSKNQRWWVAQLRNQGYAVAVCYSGAEAIGVLREWINSIT